MGDGPITAELPVDDDWPRAIIEWRIWHAKERPLVAFLVGIVLLAPAWFIVEVTDSAIAGMAGGMFLVYALRTFFFPVRYRIEEKGVYERDILHKNAFSWGEILRIESEADGASFSKRAEPGMFAEFWEISVEWGNRRVEGERLIALYWPLSESVAWSTAQPTPEEVEGACGLG